jgi:hypothetical protein
MKTRDVISAKRGIKYALTPSCGMICAKQNATPLCYNDDDMRAVDEKYVY